MPKEKNSYHCWYDEILAFKQSEMRQCILADTISGKKRVKLKQQMDFVDLLLPSVPVSKKGQIAAKESSSSSFLHVFERLCTKVAAFRHQRAVPHPNQRPLQGVAKAFCHGDNIILMHGNKMYFLPFRARSHIGYERRVWERPVLNWDQRTRGSDEQFQDVFSFAWSESHLENEAERISLKSSFLVRQRNPLNKECYCEY